MTSAQAASTPIGATASSFPATEDLEVMLRYLVEDGATPAIVVGILEPDGEMRIVSAGSAGEGARPLEPRTVFEIGSITKTFTGTLLAEMAARGEVALDDPVRRYVPADVRIPTRGGREITLLDLATHRSGLPRTVAGFVPAATENPFAEYGVDTIYRFLTDHELRRDVGEKVEYSNLGVGLLGVALGRAAGVSVKELIRRRILEPLGMRMTGYEREGELAAWHARGRSAAGRPAPYWDAGEAIAGAGGLRSTVDDMLLYLRAQIDPPDTALGRAIRQARQVHHPMDDDQAMGLCWAIRAVEGRAIVMHGGGTGGFRAVTGFDPGRRTGFVMLTNANGFPDNVGMQFLVHGAPLDLPEARVPREALARWAGEYEMEPGRSAFVRLEDDGTPTLRVPGRVRFPMHAESDSAFFLKRMPWRVRFDTDDGGAVTAMVVDMDGTERVFRRIGDRGLTPAEEAASVRDLPLSAEEMARYEGTYTLRVGERSRELRVFADGDRLISRAEGQRVVLLRHHGGHVFVPDYDPAARLVFTVQDGRAERATLHQNGREIPAERNPS